MFKLLICILLVLSGCVSTSENKIVLEKDEDYALAFFSAMNEKALATLDALLSDEATISFNGKSDAYLGSSKDQNSYLNQLLAMDSQYHNIEACPTDYSVESVCFLLKDTNFLYADIYQERVDTATRYDLVVKGNEIQLIVVNPNLEQEALINTYNSAQVGLEISYSTDNAFALITHVYPATPAYVLDIMVGDQIIAINDISINAMKKEFNEANLRLLGKPDTSVKLAIKKADTNKVVDLTLTRLKTDLYIFDDIYYD